MLNLKSFTVASAALTLFSGVTASGLYPVKRNEEPAQPSCTDFTPFKYAGCFIDNGSPRTLLYTGPRNSNQTVQDCVAFCKGNEYQYAGLEYGEECFCGASVNNIQADEADCNMSCTGDDTEICGGFNRVSIYQDPTFPVADSTTISDYQKLGCYSEGSVGRSLAWRQDQVSGTTMTVEKCLTACKAGGFSFTGIEFASECYCGVVLGNGTLPVDSSNCDMPCNGDSTETCGGRGTLDLYVAKDLESSEPCEGGSSSSSSSTISSTSTSSSDLQQHETTVYYIYNFIYTLNDLFNHFVYEIDDGINYEATVVFVDCSHNDNLQDSFSLHLNTSVPRLLLPQLASTSAVTGAQILFQSSLTRTLVGLPTHRALFKSHPAS
ncbi:hypothetical protein ACEPPN_004720 [Leptodophora sp. 'Broadleaf-Isolate-01']